MTMSYPTTKIAVSTSAWLIQEPYREPVFPYIQAQMKPPIATDNDKKYVHGELQPK